MSGGRGRGEGGKYILKRGTHEKHPASNVLGLGRGETWV